MFQALRHPELKSVIGSVGLLQMLGSKKYLRYLLRYLKKNKYSKSLYLGRYRS